MSSVKPTTLMGGPNQDARERHLKTISTMEKVLLSELVATSGESEWLWLLNAGSMDARARSGITRKENLPNSPIQVVELMGKPYALVQYASTADAAVAIETDSNAVFALASLSMVRKVFAELEAKRPTSVPRADDPAVFEFSNGLLIMYDFITVDEEAELIQEYHLATSSRTGPSLKRGAVHFGPHFDYTTFAPSTSASTPPPTYLTRLLNRLPAKGERDIPDQFTLQYYPPGTGIPPHVDTHSAFEENIYSLSFGASTRMDFRLCGEREARRMRLPKRSLGETEAPPTPPPTTEDENSEEWQLELPPRSLLVMRGASRFGYTHGIKGRKFDQQGTQIVARDDRYSLTMRKIKPLDEVRCDCAFPRVCDWRIKQERQDAGI